MTIYVYKVHHLINFSYFYNGGILSSKRKWELTLEVLFYVILVFLSKKNNCLCGLLNSLGDIKVYLERFNCFIIKWYEIAVSPSSVE